MTTAVLEREPVQSLQLDKPQRAAKKRKLHSSITPAAANKLIEVCRHILAEPEALNMETWGFTLDDIHKSVERYGKSGLSYRTEEFIRHPSSCGTMGCIAGWVCMLAGKSTRNACGTLANGILGINANRLFFLDFWPAPFSMWYHNKSVKTQALITVKRILHFLKTGE